MMRALLSGAQGSEIDAEPVIRAVGATLKSNSLDPAFKAETIILPSESVIADRIQVVDPDAIHSGREELRGAIGSALHGELLAAHRTDGAPGDDLSPGAKGVRRLRTVALGLIAAANEREAAQL